MLCLKQQMSEEPTEDDLDEEEFIESSSIHERPPHTHVCRELDLKQIPKMVTLSYHILNLESVGGSIPY
jgi:hypothetical protein